MKLDSATIALHISDGNYAAAIRLLAVHSGVKFDPALKIEVITDTTFYAAQIYAPDMIYEWSGRYGFASARRYEGLEGRGLSRYRIFKEIYK